MTRRPWVTYPLCLEEACDLAESLGLSIQTDIEPSSLGSFFFEDENDALYFILVHRGACELSTSDSNGITIVDTPAVNMPKLGTWLKDRCDTPWFATEWVRVSFWTNAERVRFEEALI